MEKGQYDPPDELTIWFCPVCQERSFYQALQLNHFVRGIPCRSTQIMLVTYGRKEIRNAHEEKK